MRARRIGSVVVALVLAVVSCQRPPPPVPQQDRPVARAAETRSALLVPRPRSMTSCPGTLTIDASTRITVDADARASGERLARWLGLPATSVDVLASGAVDPPSGIVVHQLRKDTADEAYTLDVSPRRAIVVGRSPAGAFYGAQTLAQLAGTRRIGADPPPLAGSLRVPCVVIDDAPRVPFRAMHLDVVRHFFSRQAVERYVDLLSFYRFNVFHWHLTDDQGFRFEVKKHPELTTVGGRDGFYTQDDARTVVAHARDRSIQVVPEIEMPGHARAILASHPELSCTGQKQDVPRTWGVFDDVLCAGNEKTYALMADILAEVAEVFPSPMVHVGGDEVPIKRWSACSKCRATLAASKVPITELEGVFMQRVTAMLAKLGKRPVVWDEALSERLSPDALVVAWQSKERGREAAQREHDVVMAPYQHVYFNTHQSTVRGEPGMVGFLPWTKVRLFDPLPEGLEPSKSARILGGEGAIWTEYIETPEQIDTMAMPRMAALAEALWSGPAPSETDFVTRFDAQLPMLDASNVQYFVEPPVGLPTRKVIMGAETATLKVSAPPLFPKGVVRWTRDGSDPEPSSPVFEGSLTTAESTQLAAALFLPGGRRSAVIRGAIVKEEPRPSQRVTAPSPGVDYAYAESLFYKLPDFSKIEVKTRGRARAIGLGEVKTRNERFALRFDGLVRVQEDGVYRLVAKADDGVRVQVDGETLIEDDGEHDVRESAGEIALRGGLHRLVVTYFQGSEGKALELAIEGPGLPLGPPDLVVETKRQP